MSDVISEYQRWKQQGEGLRLQARQAIETRFRELLTEAAHLAEEYRSDFGGVLKPPPQITAFRYKAGGKAKAKKAAAASKAAAPAKPAAGAPAKTAAAPAPAPKANPKVAALEKRIAGARKKLEDAKAAGSPTRAIEDKIYELEDELRLSAQA